MKKKLTFSIAIILIFALLIYLYLDHKKYSKEIIGKDIFANTLEFTSISKFNEKGYFPEIDLNDSQSKEVLAKLQNIHYINKRDNIATSKGSNYTLTANDKDKQYIISLTNNNIIDIHETHPDSNSKFYFMDEEETEAVFNLLDGFYE